MNAKVVGIISSKGGVGKSSIASALAVCAVAEGSRVALVDAEPQQSIGLWWERRGEPENPALFTAHTEAELSKTIGRLRADGFDWIIIDTPPAMITRIDLAISISDFVLIPVRASIFDAEAISPVVELCKTYGRAYAFVMSQADPKWKLLPSVVDALEEDYGPVLPEMVRYHEAYAAALTTGKTAAELKGKAGTDAREEIAALWKAVKRRVGKKGR